MNGQEYPPADYGYSVRNSHYPYALAADQRRTHSTKREGIVTSDGRWIVDGFNLNDPGDFAFYLAAKQIANENALKQKRDSGV